MDAVFHLLNGDNINSSDVGFNVSAYQFTQLSTGLDITTLLPIADKRQFPDFDATIYNKIVYFQHYQDTHAGASPPEIGSASIWSNFAHQLYPNPLGATLDEVSTVVDNTIDATDNLVTKAIGAIVTAPGLLVVIGVSAVVIYIFRKPIMRTIATAAV